MTEGRKRLSLAFELALTQRPALRREAEAEDRDLPDEWIRHDTLRCRRAAQVGATPLTAMQ